LGHVGLALGGQMRDVEISWEMDSAKETLAFDILYVLPCSINLQGHDIAHENGYCSLKSVIPPKTANQKRFWSCGASCDLSKWQRP